MSAVKQSETQQFLTVEEVAALLRVKRRTVHYWVSERRIPFRKAGRFTIFDRDEVLAWTRSGGGDEISDTVRPFSR